jgi:hypothetical protein
LLLTCFFGPVLVWLKDYDIRHGRTTATLSGLRTRACPFLADGARMPTSAAAKRAQQAADEAIRAPILNGSDRLPKTEMRA